MTGDVGALGTVADELPPLPDEPIKRIWCLETLWLTDDPMPARCGLDYGHDGRHKAPTVGMSLGSVSGPAITWADINTISREAAA